MIEKIKKSWVRKIQIFVPWNSLYIGIQFGNNTKFLWKWRESNIDEIG
jgi:hypothetical protein